MRNYLLFEYKKETTIYSIYVHILQDKISPYIIFQLINLTLKIQFEFLGQLS